MHAKSLVLAAATLAAACGQGAPSAPPETPQAEVEAPALPQTLPPPSAQTPRYVGLWAAEQGMCAEPPWRFEANEISTRGEVNCRFQNVREIPGGYEIDATCTAEAPPAPYQIRLTFAESARAMMIEGGPWTAGASLVFCRPLDGG